MSTLRTLLLATPLVLTGCSHDPEPAAAARVFEDFQRALRSGDRQACRNALTRESAAALDDLPWQQVTEREPVEVLGARREQHAFRVEVREPGTDGTAGEYVVVREFGRLVVDLVATAGLSAREGAPREASANDEEFEPRALTPADFDRIRRHELAQPAPR